MSPPLTSPRFKASTATRTFNGRVMFAAIVDGAPVDGDSEDDCFDFEDDALQAAERLAAHRAMEAA